MTRLLRFRDPSSERLVTAIFVAALLHGLVILGIRFGTPAFDAPLPTLEIMLVPPATDDPSDNQDAAYLAQRTQHGSGTGRSVQRTSVPEARQAVPMTADPGDDRIAAPPPSEDSGRAAALSRRELHARRPPAGTEVPPAPPVFQALPSPPQATVGLNATVADRALHLRGQRSVDGKLLADTRESVVAGYLDGWRRRVERVGTLNFPNEARRRGLSGNPVVEVAIRADGTLVEAVVRRSSGHGELDEAALGIVRLAAPFEPFPSALRDRHPVLRFAYEWQFLDGRLGGDGALFTTGR
jgi:periplasmic protein TonB